MGSYIMAFGVYTLAMIGVIFIAFLVWKNAVLGNPKGASSTMKVEEMLNLNARKALYVVRVRNERFLIATDVDRTTFLAKLEENTTIGEILATGKEPCVAAFSNNENIKQDAGVNKSMMRNILKELTGKNK